MKNCGKSEFSPFLFKKDFSLEFKSKFIQKTSTNAENYLVLSSKTSYSVAQLFDIFDSDFLTCVRNEVLSLEYYRKRNDLYSFLQSEDLNLIRNKPGLSRLRYLLGTEDFIRHLSLLTGVCLSIDKCPDIAAQRYLDTDHLLCHDDDISESDDLVRRIAFIIYLVDSDWDDKDGGYLDIFSHDTENNPSNIEFSIVPQWNSLAFFEVTPISYHQVREVLTCTKERISITGWFYGPRPQSLPMLVKEDISCIFDYVDYPLKDGFFLENWINESYLNSENIQKIANHFQEYSHVSLKDILKQETYNVLYGEFCNALKSPIGPPNTQNYHRIATHTDVINRFSQFIRSSVFSQWLNQITGNLGIGSCSFEIKKFSKGCYTLLRDDVIEPIGLDLSFFFKDYQAWKEVYGGETVYLSEDDHLLSIEPFSNQLVLVYRDAGVQKFTKLLSHYASSFIMVEVCFPLLEKDEDNEESEK